MSGGVRDPIEVEKFRAPGGGAGSMYFRFSREVPEAAIQPDRTRLVFVEVDWTGRLVGVLSYEPTNILIIEDIAFGLDSDQTGSPVGVTAKFSYDLKLNVSLDPQARRVARHATLGS